MTTQNNKNTKTTYSVNDYGSNISISRDIYSWDDYDSTLIDSQVIFETNADQFLPDSEEYDESWDVSEYINDYVSYFDLSAEEADFVKQALWSCNLRYLAVDGYSQWEEEN